MIYIFELYKNQDQASSHLSADTWTAMIQIYHFCNQPTEAWGVFREMERVGVLPTEHTYATVLLVLAELANMDEDPRIHQQLEVLLLYKVSCNAMQYWLTILSQEIYKGNAPHSILSTLVTMYAKNGNLNQARLISFYSVIFWLAVYFDLSNIFEQAKSQAISQSSAVTWTVMMQAYCTHKQWHKAWEIYDEMKCVEITPIKLHSLLY